MRRIAIFAILLLAYIYYRSAGEAQLASIGLLSFAAIAQLTPAFFGGLVWRRGTATGAIAGMTAGILVWAYTLLLPSISDAGIVGAHILSDGPFGVGWLRPQALFGLDLPPLVHGVVLSLLANIALYIGCSLGRRPTAIERVQADVFVPSSLAPMAPSFRLRRASVTIEELTATIARYLGEERTRKSFASFAASRRVSLEPQAEADFQLLQYGEYLLASAIGAASSRLVLSLVAAQAHRFDQGRAQAARRCQRRNPLQSRNPADRARPRAPGDRRVRQGPGAGLLEPAVRRNLRSAARRSPVSASRSTRSSATSPGSARRKAGPRRAGRRTHRPLHVEAEPFLERFAERGLVIEVRADRMPDGGLVTTFTDITPSVKAAEALERANATLERRVRERTGELTRLNAELERAKAEADEANVSKTRFLAAASHDILQPLNAARLYVTSLIERQRAGEDGDLVQNIDASLEAVEEIFAALLDISRLDTGAMQPEITDFRIDELLHRLEVEFAPLAREKGLDLKFMPCSLAVRSDRRLLRRLLAEPRLQRHQIHAQGQRAGRLPAPRHTAAHRRLRYRHRHSASQAPRGVQGIPPSRPGRAGRARRRPRPLDRRTHRPRARLRSGAEIECRPRLALFRRSAARRSPRSPGRSGSRAESRRRAARRHGGAVHRQRASILDGMQTLLGGWGCRVLKAADLAEALAAIEGSGLEPDGLLVDYHLDGGNGIGAIAELRRRHGRDLAAILVTADRSLHVREEARTAGVHVLQQAGQAGVAARVDDAVARAARRGGVGLIPRELGEGQPAGRNSVVNLNAFKVSAFQLR